VHEDGCRHLLLPSSLKKTAAMTHVGLVLL
jgi:hypothetical protein